MKDQKYERQTRENVIGVIGFVWKQFDLFYGKRIHCTVIKNNWTIILTIIQKRSLFWNNMEKVIETKDFMPTYLFERFEFK